MAEFFEVMKQARRMCHSISCDICMLPELYEWMCVWGSKPLEFTDEIIAKIESKTLQWAAEHPEPKYPTWREWQAKKFPGGNAILTPCHFMMMQEWMGISGCDCRDCDVCSERPIPDDIARKLGIKPKEA